jgi:hypothetical protein
MWMSAAPLLRCAGTAGRVREFWDNRAERLEEMMVRIIDRRSEALPGERVAKLRVWRKSKTDVRACLLPVDVFVDLSAMMIELSDPVRVAFRDAISRCEKDGVAALWVHDPVGLFPPNVRDQSKITRRSSTALPAARAATTEKQHGVLVAAGASTV